MENKIPHCIFLPCPIFGRVNPMFQFAQILHKNGIQITFLISKFMAKNTLFHSHSKTFSLLAYSDGFDDGHPPDITPDAAIAQFRQVVRTTLTETFRTLAADSGRPVHCFVYDPFMPDGLEVAVEFGLTAAAFFPQSCTVTRIFDQVYKGELEGPVSGDRTVVIPGLPPLEPRDLPSFIYVPGSLPAVFRLLIDQFRELEKAKWVFINTFHKLEEQIIDYMSRFSSVKPIGPTTVPSIYSNTQLSSEREIDPCINWLNQREPNSVIYVSFGTMVKMGEDQMNELAWGLRSSKKQFIWVVRSLEQPKLPREFSQEVSDRGLIVPWAPQLDVLAHEATCTFFTHCGWNSTLEALSLGVSMIAMPQLSDQPTNSKYVEDVWKMGIRVVVGDNGLVSRDEIARCVREVSDGEKGDKMRRNAKKWKELAKEAMDKCGSSHNNIQEIVLELKKMAQV